MAAASSLSLAEEAARHDNHIIPVANANLSLFSGPRDYYTLLVLTSTDPKHECGLCDTLPEVVSTVAHSWHADYSSGMLFFTTVDVVDRTNIPIFEKLQLDSIPHVWLIPPNMTASADPYSLLDNVHYAFKLPVGGVSDQVLELARFLSELLQKNIAIRDEAPASKFVKTFVAVFAVIVFLKKRGPSFIRGQSRRKGYAIFIVILTLVFVSGYQFTTSQGTPFVARNEEGIIYISGGLYYQFGIEIVMVAANYFSLAMTLIAMIYLGRYQITETSRIHLEATRSALVVVANVVLFVLFSCLTSMFLRKEHGYPYGLAKLF
ncbi:subunit of N oligosaccharyltransferase complex [Suhomyces tanzawaensis NRRL Y-17324]|uniref:Subunit of N oligosaccharyltransferase complex n=1 Tax=Suhomyces tanzawaensis NRRL Y-17324 TaxID=984487 RepID=A0A1E4SIG3_9ASCO|nr:subunit of N oligosaccharyltransferase complex [Suhomyces tanzawaensis NRRL Y-17324]ODV79303.1 subunit of N oligosaccharyltransferase complex [Suhomyces tanzawaensis NRRL Y-17324]